MEKSFNKIYIIFFSVQRTPLRPLTLRLEPNPSKSRPKPYVFGIIKFWSFFLEAVNQLKNTTDCIKIDPPGPGQNLEKKSKKSKNDPKFGAFFHAFTVKTRVFFKNG